MTEIFSRITLESLEVISEEILGDTFEKSLVEKKEKSIEDF